MKTISSDYKRSHQEQEWKDSCRKARIEAVAYIGHSTKSSGKISGWLLRKSYPDSIISFVIQELKEEGVIRDDYMAAAILRSRRGNKLESSSSVRNRMIRQGIDRKIAEKCVEEAYKEEDRELSDAIILLRLKFERKIDTIDESDPTERLRFQQRIFRFLLGRGYNRGIALTAMNAVFKEQAYIEE